jgi:hypothetical protein
MSSRGDVIDEVLKDHREIKELFSKVRSSTGTRKRGAFQALVRKLAVHETAEQEIVHPLALGAGADDIRDRRVSEEKEAEGILSELVKIGPEDPRFPPMLEALQREVLEHAEREEREEHPKIRSDVDADRLRMLAAAFRAAEATAPTRPHPRGPRSATGNLLVGPIVSIMDRARDAIRDAMQPKESTRGSRTRPTSTRGRTKDTARRSTTRAGDAPVIDVAADPKGGWRAAKRGSSRAIARSSAKQDVVRRAREVAKSQRGRLVIHRQDGRIQEERTYGKDPARTRG